MKIKLSTASGVTRLAFIALALSLVPIPRAHAETAPPPLKASVSVQDFALLDHQGAFRHLYYYAKDPATKGIVMSEKPLSTTTLAV